MQSQESQSGTFGAVNDGAALEWMLDVTAPERRRELQLNLGSMARALGELNQLLKHSKDTELCKNRRTKILAL
jgi:hypothetical protein